MPVAYHMVHYRKCESESPEFKARNFEQICRMALSKSDQAGVVLWERAQDRLWHLQDATGKQVMLNKVADLTSAVAGEICLIQTKGLQALLELQASKVKLSNITLAEIYALNEKSAPIGSQFVRGMAYWMAIGNHLFFIKTQGMTSELIQSYFDWLFKGCTAVVPTNANFQLQAEFDKSQVSGNVGDIQSLRVSGKSAPQFSVTTINMQETGKTISTSKLIKSGQYTFEKAREIAETLFGKQRSDALVESLGPEEYLSVDAAVKVRGRRTESSKAKMKELANDLADLTEGKVQVEGKDGRVSDEDAILRTRMPFNLSHEGSSLLEFDNVSDQIQEVYSRFVRDKKIVA